ncbi:Omp28-related outer membrane protein [Winogradskyella sp. MH6]|uniref:Omp28-related outer membrane protein n=1 Tax=Winogradskyella sp. MH6 TaxID=2929510 RepID=UPI001FB56283|nr:Omp28-related outer membrane protein [Winogradskyella sp. MH6]
MKTKHLINLLFIALTISFSACSSDSDGDGSVNGGGNEITSISVQVSSSVTCGIYVGDTVSFSVKGNNNQDVTNSATISVNGTAITGNSYTTTTAGSLQVTATYQDITTNNSLNVNVAEDYYKFTKNVLVEDYTGTWCGYCPRVSHAIELTNQQTDQINVVAIHRYNSNPSGSGYDPYNFEGAGVLESSIGLTGYPTAMIDRGTTWTYPEPSNVSQVVNKTLCDNAPLGLAITPSLSGNTMTIKVDAKFSQNFSFANTKLVVVVLEDDLIFDQENYTSYYGGVDVISSFEHDHVLRASLTNILGDNLPNNEVTNSVYSRTITADVPSNVVNTSKMSVVAFITNENFNGDAYTINSRMAHFGDAQTYEEN